MPLPRPRSVLGRAVLPVVGGATVLAAIFAATLGIAAWNSRGGGEPTTRLAPRELPVGNVESVAETIADTGPILFPGLNTTTGSRTLILDHQGGDPTRGWRVYLAYPAEADASCAVTQIRDTASSPGPPTPARSSSNANESPSVSSPMSAADLGIHRATLAHLCLAPTRFPVFTAGRCWLLPSAAS